MNKITFETGLRITEIIKRTDAKLFKDLIPNDEIILKHELNTENNNSIDHNRCYYDVYCTRTKAIRKAMTMYQVEKLLKNFKYIQINTIYGGKNEEDYRIK